MVKRCVCGRIIPRRRDLCSACLEAYGTKREQWPAWLRRSVNDEKREHKWYRAHGCREGPFPFEFG